MPDDPVLSRSEAGPAGDVVRRGVRANHFLWMLIHARGVRTEESLRSSGQRAALSSYPSVGCPRCIDGISDGEVMNSL